MAHRIENQEIAYVGETPWHGLGTRMPAGASAEEMLAAAKLAWEVAFAPVTVDPHWRGGKAPRADLFAAVLPVKAIIRSDNGRYFGMTSWRYTPVQNRETVAFFQEFCDRGEVALETVGAINGGEWVWALAKVNEDAINIDGDLIEPYLLIANSHVPGRSLVIKATLIRVVCHNTLTLSLRETSQEYGRFPHNRDILRNLANARSYVRAALRYQHRFHDAVATLIRTPVNEETAVGLIERVFKVKPEAEGLKRILALFGGKQIGADTMSTVDANAWGLFNAVTQYLDYEVGRSQDNRLRSAWFGQGEKIKSKLLVDLLALSGVNKTEGVL